MPIVVMGTEAARRGAHFAGTARHGKSGLNGVLRVFWNCIECCKIRIIDAGGVVAVVMAALLPVDQHMCDVQLAATVNQMVILPTRSSILRPFAWQSDLLCARLLFAPYCLFHLCLTMCANSITTGDNSTRLSAAV